MSKSLGNVIRLHNFPGGRRELAQSQVAERARDMNHHELADHCHAAVDNEQQLRGYERRYRFEKKQPVHPRLCELDPKIDRITGGIYRVAKEAAILDDVELAELAQRVIDELYPAGAAAVTQLPYTEQVHEVDSILRELQVPGSLAPAVLKLGLSPHVSQLATMNGEFRAIVATLPLDVPTWDKVRARRAEAQERLLQTVAIIVGTYPGSSPEHVEARTKLLRPILDQEEAVYQFLRARRRVRDVDPATGTEVPPAGEDTPEPAGEDGAGSVVEDA